MNLYVFVPYEWDYCGGAIGVVASDFDEAVEIIKAVKHRQPGTSEERFPYKNHLFIKPEREYEYLAKEDSWEQWILEYECKTDDDKGPRVVFDNWNNA